MRTVPAWLPWALLSAVFAAATAITAKVGLEGVDPDYATFVRTVVVAVVLGALVAGAGKMRDPRLVPPRALLFLTLSALATGASWVCYFRALQRGPAARVAPVDKLSVVLVALVAAGALGERLSPLAWAGVALVGGGVVLLSVAR